MTVLPPPREDYEEEFRPPPLPQKRRSLSNPPARNTRLSREFIHQTCEFFAKLPPEVRRMIYVECLGNRVLHMVTLRKRVGCFRCPSVSAPDFNRECLSEFCRTRLPEPPWFFPDDFTRSAMPLALLQTCRQVYMEAIDVLYATNTFDFAHGETCVWFTETILPQRLASIASLQIGWYELFFSRGRSNRPPGHGADWYDLTRMWAPMWQSITTKLPGLKRLEILITNTGDSKDACEILLPSLLPLRGLNRFGLQVIWHDQVQPLSPLGLRISELAVTPRDLLPGQR